MKFSIVCVQDQPVLQAVKDWQACERAGMAMVGVVDSPVVFRELYVTMSACVLQTERAQVMTYVTNPLSRHPSVTASALMSLYEMAPGRVALGIGTGDSAMWSVGLGAARIDYIRDYILAVKGLLAGRRVTWQGQEFEPAWRDWTPAEIPIYVACAGPRITRMAAEVADGMILGLGFSPDDIARIYEIIDEGCAAGGRTRDALDLWWNARLIFADSAEQAQEQSLGWTPMWLTMGTMEGKDIPEEYKNKLRELNRDSHDVLAAYRTAGRDRLMVERARELGIYEWLLSRSPRVWGTPADVIARLKELNDRFAMENWVFFAAGQDLHTVLDTMASRVLPHLE